MHKGQSEQALAASVRVSALLGLLLHTDPVVPCLGLCGDTHIKCSSLRFSTVHLQHRAGRERYSGLLQDDPRDASGAASSTLGIFTPTCLEGLG